MTVDLFSVAPWHAVTAFKQLAYGLKADFPIPQAVDKITAHTSNYEKFIKSLWEQAKADPTESNINDFIGAMATASDEVWAAMFLDVLAIEELAEIHKAQIAKEVAQNRYYLQNSLLPDLLKELGKGSDAFNKFDYRVIFMYSGALWSSGMLATVMFDGLEFRDLADLFLFSGPNDKRTCGGDRGCDQHVGKIYTVAQILAQDIIPGRLACYTNCRHMLIPIASPLGEKQKHLPGKHSQQTHGHTSYNPNEAPAAELKAAGYIPVYRGTGPEGMKVIRPSTEGVAGPGVYFYDDVAQARSYAELGGGIITGFVHPDDVVTYPVKSSGLGLRGSSHNVIVLKMPNNFIRRGDLSVEDSTLSVDELRRKAELKLDEALRTTEKHLPGKHNQQLHAGSANSSIEQALQADGWNTDVLEAVGNAATASGFLEISRLLRRYVPEEQYEQYIDAYATSKLFTSGDFHGESEEGWEAISINRFEEALGNPTARHNLALAPSAYIISNLLSSDAPSTLYRGVNIDNSNIQPGSTLSLGELGREFSTIDPVGSPFGARKTIVVIDTQPQGVNLQHFSNHPEERSWLVKGELTVVDKIGNRVFAEHKLDTLQQAHKHLPGKHNQQLHGRKFMPKIFPHLRGAVDYAKSMLEDKIAVTDEERQAALWYTLGGDHTKTISGYLRGRSDHVLQPLPEFDENNDRKMKVLTPEEITAYAKALDSLIAKSPVPEDLYLHRVVTANFAEIFQLGTKFKDPGYVSTSLAATDSVSIIDETSSKLAVLRIKVPKGTGAAWMDNYGGYSNKSEMLLGRNLTFNVDDIHKLSVAELAGASAAEWYDSVPDMDVVELSIV